MLSVFSGTELNGAIYLTFLKVGWQQLRSSLSYRAPTVFAFILGLMEFKPIKGWKSVYVLQLQSQLKFWPTSLPPVACISRVGIAVKAVFKNWVTEWFRCKQCHGLQQSPQAATVEQSRGQKLVKMVLQFKMH